MLTGDSETAVVAVGDLRTLAIGGALASVRSMKQSRKQRAREVLDGRAWESCRAQLFDMLLLGKNWGEMTRTHAQRRSWETMSATASAVWQRALPVAIETTTEVSRHMLPKN